MDNQREFAPYRAERLQRAEQIEEWVKLTAEKVAQVAPPLGGEQPADKGIRAATRELGIDRRKPKRLKRFPFKLNRNPEAADLSQASPRRPAISALTAVKSIVQSRSPASHRRRRKPPAKRG